MTFAPAAVQQWRFSSRWFPGGRLQHPFIDRGNMVTINGSWCLNTIWWYLMGFPAKTSTSPWLFHPNLGLWEVSWQTCPDQHQLLLQGVHAPLHGKRILRRQGLGHGLEHPESWSSDLSQGNEGHFRHLEYGLIILNLYRHRFPTRIIALIQGPNTSFLWKLEC